MEKRTWTYLQPPKDYCVAPCDCGNNDTQWSEYKAHLWCAKCERDFIPEHNGVFDGPILMAAAHMMGMYFSTRDLQTGKYTVMGQSFQPEECIDWSHYTNTLPVNLRWGQDYDSFVPAMLNLDTMKISFNEVPEKIEKIVKFTTELIFDIRVKHRFKLTWRRVGMDFNLVEDEAAGLWHIYLEQHKLAQQVNSGSAPRIHKI